MLITCYLGVYLVYEVNHRSVNRVKSGIFFKCILVSQAIMNFALWADALFDAACRVEPDNAILFGDDFWIICKPIFKAALVALRILSALLFLMLAMHSDDYDRDTQEASSKKESSDKESNELTKEQTTLAEKTIRKYESQTEGLARAIDQVGAVIKILMCDLKTSKDELSLKETVQNNKGMLKKSHSEFSVASRIKRTLSPTLKFMLKRTNLNYGVSIRLSRMSGDKFFFTAEAISSKQVGTEGFIRAFSFFGLLFILIPPVVLGYSLKLLKDDDVAKYAPELVIHIIVISCCCFLLIPSSPCCHWSIKTRMTLLERVKDLVFNPELTAVTIFCIFGGVIYHFLLFVLLSKENRFFVTGWPQVDVFSAVVSAVLKLVVIWIFRMHKGATFRKRNDSLTEVVLGLLVVCSISLLIMDIQREEFDKNEHILIHHGYLWVEPLIGVLAPLSIDFDLHAALLLYCVFYDYVGFAGECGTLPDSDNGIITNVGDWNESMSAGDFNSLFVEESLSPFSETSV